MSTEFDRIYAETRLGVTRFIAGLLRNDADREECFQETYLRLWKQCEREIPERPFGWLVVVSRRIARDLPRRPVGTLVAEPRAPDQGGELALAIDEAMASLPPALLETFLLRHEGGLAYAEIAGELDIPIGTVASRIHEAVRLLRLHLVRDLEAEERKA